ncbi:MAG: alpha-N-arabinofuranosidase [Opitutaceae bacterium]|nr:alpha-N-arabinofuranosidase [Opitutaceae bacterium]
MSLRHALLILTMALTTLASSGADKVRLQLDTSATAADPISPLIYGQFIEHLGRCIYGGIWAEMLEDRKFYFPITAEYAPYRDLKDSAYPVVGASPWEILGAADDVTMATENAFVGRHSPRLAPGAAIRQRDLGVVAGKAYAGYLWARPLSGETEIEVTLATGDANPPATARLTFTGTDFTKQVFTLTSPATTERGATFSIQVLRGEVLLGPPSLMPADNKNGLRPDTLALLKQLNSPVYRWPGGNFVSGYDWRDGVGDRDRRPPRKNPAWTGVEHNDFGTDEFLAFCRELGTEPMIAVNTGLGDAYSAAQWLEYCNAASTTLAGGWREKNGHAAPYAVKYWCVGNEMWGPFQLGWMQLHHYVIKHNLVAEAMRAVDPTVTLVGVGDIDQINKDNDPQQVRRGIPWSHGMLEACADHMDMLSEHFYAGRVPWWDASNTNTYHNGERVDLLSHVRQVKDAIRHRADKHRALQPTLPSLNGRTMPISMDEWNYWHREYAYGELGCVYELQDGLGIAAGLHEFYRHTDIIKVATYAQTVNVIGAIKTSKIAAEMETTGLVLALYRAHYGEIPLKIAPLPEPLDLAAALTADRQTLTVGLVNPTDRPVPLALELTGAIPRAMATRWHITGASPTAHNAPGQPRAVDIVETKGVSTGELVAPALSVTLFSIPLR